MMVKEQSLGQILDAEMEAIEKKRDILIKSIHGRNEKLSELRSKIKEFEKQNQQDQSEIGKIDVEKTRAIAKILKSTGIAIEATDKPVRAKNKKRLTKAEMENACIAIMKSMKRTQSATHGSLSDDTGLTREVVKSAVMKLKKENELKSDGRGLAAMIVLA